MVDLLKPRPHIHSTRWLRSNIEFSSRYDFGLGESGMLMTAFSTLTEISSLFW